MISCMKHIPDRQPMPALSLLDPWKWQAIVSILREGVQFVSLSRAASGSPWSSGLVLDIQALTRGKKGTLTQASVPFPCGQIYQLSLSVYLPLVAPVPPL